VLLDDLPAKTFHTLLRSITWTEVEVAFPIKNPLRRFVSHLARPSRWVVGIRQSHPIVWGRLIKLRASVARLRG
jgi:hypothetical protein